MFLEFPLNISEHFIYLRRTERNLIKNQPELQSSYQCDFCKFKHWKFLLQGTENKTKMDIIK